MNPFLHGSAELKNVTVQNVQEAFLRFPVRYHNYRHKQFKGRWKCVLLDSNAGMVKLQLVNPEFDLPRGRKAPYESPIMFIKMQQSGNNVVLTYKLRWKKTVIFCVIALLLFAILSFSLALPTIWNDSSITKFSIPLGISLCLLLIDVIWIYRKRIYDKQILAVFVELLRKNFNIQENNTFQV